MRTAIMSVFVVALGMICTANPAAAQSNQNSSPPRLSLLPQSPFANAALSVTNTSASSDSRNVLSPNTANVFGSLKDQAKRPSAFGDQRWRIVPPKERLHAKSRPPADMCAHILIHRIWSLDSNPMVIQPKGSADQIPSAKGLPVCREDIR